jgi:hypothetical protein
MHVNRPALISSLILVGMAMSVPARANEPWPGPGWYVENTALELMNEVMGGGLKKHLFQNPFTPFASQKECEAALAKREKNVREGRECKYYESDPDA